MSYSGGSPTFCNLVRSDSVTTRLPSSPEAFFDAARLPERVRMFPHLARAVSAYKIGDGNMMAFYDLHQREIPDLFVAADGSMSAAIAAMGRQSRNDLATLLSLAARAHSMDSIWDDGSPCNRHNERVFSRADKTADSEDFFRLPIFTDAFERFLLRRFHHGSMIRIKELGGGDCFSQWATLDRNLNPKYGLDIVVTDFCDRSELMARSRSQRIRFERLNLLQALPSIEQEHRFDLLTAFLVFDCIWYPQDRTYYYGDGQWARVFFREKNQRAVDHIHVPVQIQKEPFGELIEQFKPDSGFYITIPFGLVAKVHEAFATQLQDDGAMLLGQMSSRKNGSNNGSQDPFKYSPNSLGCFRHLQLEIAQELLRYLGYKSELTGAIEWCRSLNPSTVLDQACRAQEDHSLLKEINEQTVVMVIERAR